MVKKPASVYSHGPSRPSYETALCLLHNMHYRIYFFMKSIKYKIFDVHDHLKISHVIDQWYTFQEIRGITHRDYK